MTDVYEGDIIQPLGLITLYAGYAELEIDRLLESLSSLSQIDDQKRRWPVGQKIVHARKLVNGLHTDRLDELEKVLAEAIKLFDRRNALVHSAIFSSTSVVSSRVSGREQPISPEALINLADDIFEIKEQIALKRQRLLEPVLIEIKASKDG